MRTILIPVDLSEASENVLDYAADFCADNCVDRVILLKCHYVSVYEQLLPTPDFVQRDAYTIEEERTLLKERLIAAGQRLRKKCSETTQVETAMSSEQLVRAVHNQIAEKQPNLVMIGCDKTSEETNNRSGEQIIALAKTSPIPVMIVPSNVKYQKIETALVPCDFSAISRLEALQGWHSRQRWLHPELMVLSVDPKQKQITEDGKLSAGLQDMLHGYSYTVYSSHANNMSNGILSFARKQDVQMIIALPGKYSFFYNLT